MTQVSALWREIKEGPLHKLHINTHSNREEDSIVSSQLRAESSVALIYFFVRLGLESLLFAIHPLFQAPYACILYWEELGWPIWGRGGELGGY